jgi:predicted  nucleic acid-binding Zn-ribbon protein
MGKVKQDKRKPETIIRETRRLLKHMRADRDKCIDAATTARMEAAQYRARATKAEQDAAKWQTRFDTLLTCLAQDVRERIGLKPGIFGGEA